MSHHPPTHVMPHRARRAASGAAVALAVLATAAPLRAQGAPPLSARLAPGVVSYTIGGDGGARITETVVPVATVVRITDRLTADLATAYVSVRTHGGDASTSRGRSDIQGLTDTQLRANYTLGTDAVVITAGLNLPTGRYAVADDELDAAGRIGNDFLGFPVSSMGDGLAATAGLAAARPFGAWNVGVALATRHSAAFDAFAVEEGTVRFRPADEYRARVGVDRLVGAGQMSAGLTYSAFGRDAAGPTTYGTGDRVVLQGSYAQPVGNAELLLDGWSLYHAAGETTAGPMPWENVASVAVAARWRVGSGSVEPNLELRDWMRERSGTGHLTTLGVRGRVPLPRGVQLFPSAGFAAGRLAAEPSSELRGDSVRGWQLSLALRY